MLMTPKSGPAILAPRSEAELAELVMQSRAEGRALHVCGGATRHVPPAMAAGTCLTLRDMDGIVTYSPGELTLVARVGTPVDEIEAALAAEGQALAFEPMDHRVLLGTQGVPTIGGIVATNTSGPRRIHTGACRDHLLGVRFVDGQGRIIKNGGRVMKNVTGLDLGKLQCGAHGTLGVLSEVALKTLPLAESQQTLSFPALGMEEAVRLFATALATPFEVSGAAYHAGTAWLRIEGLTPQVAYRRERLKALFRGHEIGILEDAESRAHWRGIRDVAHFAGTGCAVWRIFVKPGDAPATAAALQAHGGEVALDWGGGLLWYAGDAPAHAVHAAVGAGRAMLVRAGTAPAHPAFTPEAPAIAALSAALRRTFDPAGMFNPGLMGSQDANTLH